MLSSYLNHARSWAYDLPCRKPGGFRTSTSTLTPRLPLFLQSIRRDAFVIIEGCVVIYQQLGDDRRQTLDILGPGRIFSYAMASIENCDAEAVVPTRIRPLEGSPESQSSALQAALFVCLQRIQAHATLLGRKTAGERVASVLLDLADQFSRGNRKKPSFTIYLTREEIADYLGLTLETVSRHLNRLKRSGVITFDRPELVTIINRSDLEALASVSPRSESLRANPSHNEHPVYA